MKFAAYVFFFVFDNDYYCQIDYTVMESPSRPTFTNGFYVITKNSGSQIVRLILNFRFLDVMLMKCLLHFTDTGKKIFQLHEQSTP